LSTFQFHLYWRLIWYIFGRRKVCSDIFMTGQALQQLSSSLPTYTSQILISGVLPFEILHWHYTYFQQRNLILMFPGPINLTFPTIHTWAYIISNYPSFLISFLITFVCVPIKKEASLTLTTKSHSWIVCTFLDLVKRLSYLFIKWLVELGLVLRWERLCKLSKLVTVVVCEIPGDVKFCIIIIG